MYSMFVTDGDSLFFPGDRRMRMPQRPTPPPTGEQYVAYNNVPMGATHYRGRLFVTVPRRRPGIPSTLNYVLTKSSPGSSPSFRPYPDLETNSLDVSTLCSADRIIIGALNHGNIHYMIFAILVGNF